MDREQGGRWALGALLLGAVGAGGFFAGALMPEGPRQAAPASMGARLAEETAGTDGLRELMTELRGAVAQLGAAAERLADARASSPARVVDAPQSEAVDLEELAAALRELADALRASPAGSGGAMPLRTSDRIDRAAAFALERLRELDMGEDPRFAEALDERRAELLLQTRQQVLGRYGKPDRIHVDQFGLVRWYYELPAGEGRDRYTVRFHDGVAIDLNYEYDD